MRGLLLALVCVPAFGQDATRVFHLTDFTSPGGAQEIAAAVRTVAQARQVSFLAASTDLAVTGSTESIAVADWLVPKLDVPPDFYSEPQRFPVSGNSNDVLDIVELKNADAYAALEEMTVTLRTVGGIDKIHRLSETKMLVFRGDALQIGLAEFLIGQLDQAPSQRQVALVHRFPMKGESTIVYGLVNANSNTRTQGILAALKNVLGIFQVARNTTTKLLAIRGSQNAIRMAEWLIPKLDTQTTPAADEEIAVPGSLDDIVHVFYLKHLTNMVGVSRVYEALRAAPQMSKTYYYSITPPALIVRGSAAQISLATQIVSGTDQSPN
jgi:hypothetical protein